MQIILAITILMLFQSNKPELVLSRKAECVGCDFTVYLWRNGKPADTSYTFGAAKIIRSPNFFTLTYNNRKLYALVYVRDTTCVYSEGFDLRIVSQKR